MNLLFCLISAANFVQAASNLTGAGADCADMKIPRFEQKFLHPYCERAARRGKDVMNAIFEFSFLVLRGHVLTSCARDEIVQDLDASSLQWQNFKKL